MPAAPTLKTCRLCRKDVAGSKRVKDPEGHYYCEPCHQAAVQKIPAAPKPAPISVDDGEYDLVPSAETARNKAASVAVKLPNPAAPAAATTTAEKSGTPAAAMPKFCPNCDAPVIAHRKLCIRCHRDVTNMDKLLAMKADADKTDKADVIATWIGRVIRYSLILVVFAIVVFLGIGGWLMFHPAGAFDDYSTTREGAVRTFLSDIAQGTDKSYNSAFLLVSFRERQTNNDHEELL